MTGERQVLFLLDEKLLKRLDRAIAKKGFKTRNAWFRNLVEQEIESAKRK